MISWKVMLFVQRSWDSPTHQVGAQAESKAYRGPCFHGSLRAICCIGKSLFMVLVNISYTLSSKNMARAMGDHKHAQ